MEARAGSSWPSIRSMWSRYVYHSEFAGEICGLPFGFYDIRTICQEERKVMIKPPTLLTSL